MRAYNTKHNATTHNTDYNATNAAPRFTRILFPRSAAMSQHAPRPPAAAGHLRRSERGRLLGRSACKGSDGEAGALPEGRRVRDLPWHLHPPLCDVLGWTSKLKSRANGYIL